MNKYKSAHDPKILREEIGRMNNNLYEFLHDILDNIDITGHYSCPVRKQAIRVEDYLRALIFELEILESQNIEDRKLL